MIKLVTGSTGTEHVTAADDGGLHAALAGSGLVVFETGTKFSATMIDATNVRIGDGEGLMDGRHFRIEPGTSQELSMSAGVAGYNRNDLIVLHYVNSGGRESLTLKVLEGAFSSDAAVDPSYTSGSILNGATEAYFPMYRLNRNGINVPTVEALFTAYKPTDKTPANHSHNNATTSAAGFMSAADKNNLDTVVGRVDQSLTKTSSPTFSSLTATGTITADKVVGAVYA